jgi:hypothetical protein
MWKTSLALFLCVVAVAAISAVSQTAPLIIIDHPTIIDGNGGPPIKDGAIVIQGERIQQIGPRERSSLLPAPYSSTRQGSL